MTTKTAAKTEKTVKDTATEATNKVANGAREFVKRSTGTVHERAESAYEATKSYNAQMEDTLKRAASGYANILGSIAEAAYGNFNHTLAAVEKLADAKSASEAMQIQADYVREHSAKNMEHVRSAYDYVRDVTSENLTAVREGYSKMLPTNGKKAA